MTVLLLWILAAVYFDVQYGFSRHLYLFPVIVLEIILGVLIHFLPLLSIFFMLCLFLILHGELMKQYPIFVVGLFFLSGLIAYIGNVSFACFLSFILLILLEYLMDTLLKQEEEKNIAYQNKLLKQQVDEIENMYLTMRGWRHDYHNHLQSLKSYVKLGQLNEMEMYLKDLEKDLDSIDTTYHSGNIQIDAILNAKLSIAEQKKIPVKCDATLPPTLHVNEIDLCVIIGNLLDNAMESCMKVERKEDRFIRVYISVLKQQLYISITNATNESVRVRTDAYFSTKRGDHGHGLKRVDKVVARYQGYLNRQNEPGVFATEILLPL